MGNFLPLLSEVEKQSPNKSKWSDYINYRVSLFIPVLMQFRSLVKSQGGRLFVMELLPCPHVLDEKESKLPKHLQKLGWRMYIRLNREIREFNRVDGHVRTLNVNRYLTMQTVTKKTGKVRMSEKYWVSLSSDDDEEFGSSKEKRVRKGLHESDGIHLQEPCRLVIVNVIANVIRKSNSAQK